MMTSSTHHLQSSYLKLEGVQDLYNTPLGDYIPQSLRGEDAEENRSLCPSLSFKERLIGFSACVLASVVLSVLSCVLIFTLDFDTFAVVYTAANIFSVVSTFFLCGPRRQLKSMFASQRWIAALVFLACLILTFVAALAIKIAALTILTVLGQYLAMTWYSLSYIPLARDAVLAFVSLKQ